MASKKIQAPPDSIRSAFQDSHYATPYNDHSIPGGHPAPLPAQQHRLGRDHAPDPVTASHLLHNMEVVTPPPTTTTTTTGAAGGPSTVTEPSYGCKYILNSNRNGRRHYEERRGQERTEDDWGSRKAYAPPAPRPQAADRHGRGKAKGAFHDGCRTAEDAAAREAETQRRELGLAGGRRGYAPGPHDHSHIELGLWHLASKPAAAPADNTDSSDKNNHNHNIDVLVIDEGTSDAKHRAAAAEAKSSKQMVATTTENPIVPSATEGTTTGGGGGGGDRMQVYIPSVRPEMADIGYGSAYNQNYNFQYSAQARREQKNQRDVNEDVKAVRDLPKW